MYPSSGSGPTPAIPDLPPSDPNDHYEQYVPPPALPPPHGRLWVQITLLALTLLTTTVAGVIHYLNFALDVGEGSVRAQVVRALSDPFYYANGLWYSLSILAILGCHEMGHYVACLRYDVTATRPYFLPVPPIPFITGTLGAFIRIRSRIPNKIALFDIGVAGPIAGFVVTVPLLIYGVMLSRIQKLPENPEGLYLGEPLLFRLVAWMVWGDVSDDYSISLHPMAFAAWFGLLATALNLFPLSQLDGGHIAYAVFGRRSTLITFITIGVAIGLTFFSSGWLIWTALMVGMLYLIGPHHPPTLDDDITLGPGRLIVAAIALAILIVCFTPAPISELVATP